MVLRRRSVRVRSSIADGARIARPVRRRGRSAWRGSRTGRSTRLPCSASVHW